MIIMGEARLGRPQVWLGRPKAFGQVSSIRRMSEPPVG